MCITNSKKLLKNSNFFIVIFFKSWNKILCQQNVKRIAIKGLKCYINSVASKKVTNNTKKKRKKQKKLLT